MLYTLLSLALTCLTFFSSLPATFFLQIPEIPLSVLFSCLCDVCPFAVWILKPVGNLCSPPQVFPHFVLGVDCGVVIPTVGTFGWSPPEDSPCGESTQKPPFPAELQETLVVEGGRGTEGISSRVTQAKGNALGLFQLACPVLAGLKEVLGSQGLVHTNIFWNSSEKEMSA